MNIETFSPAMVLAYVFILLWILMGIRLSELTRHQKIIFFACAVVLPAFNHVLRVHIGSETYGKLILLTLHVPTYLLYRYLTGCSRIKMFFMILTALVFTTPAIIIGNAVRRVFFVDSLPALFLSNVISYALLLLLAQLVFRRNFNHLLKYGDDRTCLRFMLVPLIYYVYALSVVNVDFSLLPPTEMGNLMLRFYPTITVFLFYFLMLNIYEDLSHKQELELMQSTLSQQLYSAQEQIALLNTSQSRMAVYQHDMRHHLNALEALISAGSPDQAEEYIKHIRSDVEAITPRRFCENELVNLLCSSFADKADRENIPFTVDTKLPGDLAISDTELCSILSNGLENALRAAGGLSAGEKWVKLYCGMRANKLLLEIKNPYQGKLLIRNDLPVSTEAGHGYGCRSIRAIAERNRGLCSFEADDGIFTLRVMLPVRKQ